MSTTPFRVVPMNVARNPVARAISKAQLVDALRTFQMRVHTMVQNENAFSDVDAGVKALTVCILAMDLAGHGDHPSINIMRGAQSALIQCAARKYRWHTIDATSVDQGLQCVADIYPQLSANVMAEAWQQLRRIEQRMSERVSSAPNEVTT